jgi:hypothetical protein
MLIRERSVWIGGQEVLIKLAEIEMIWNDACVAADGFVMTLTLELFD